MTETIRLIIADGKAEREALGAMRRRAASVGAEIEKTARGIMDDVAARGFDAVTEYSEKFDGRAPYELPQSELDRAYRAIPEALRVALRRSAENIRAYQEKLMPRPLEWRAGDGVMLGAAVRGLDRVGIYVPGGTAAYPSSVLMNAVPARVAGVREIIMLTPPTGFLSDAVLAAAKIAEVDRVIAVGGAQAVAAVAYGAGFIPRVDKLVGPGNAYVAAAKRLAYGAIDIDMVAGPSEILVIADDSADPRHIAADLLSQAEHDALASAVLLTDSRPLAEAVREETERRLEALPRKEIARRSLRDYGMILVCESLARCVELANEIAPEHLEIVTANPRALLPGIRNAGAVFLGAYTPEPVGDYMAGPSHVLPTSGTARFFSPLSVDAFLKKMSLIEFSKDALAAVAGDTAALARAEELEAHARSVEVRLK